MQCICGHDEELHDAYAGKCIHCDCDIFRVDVSALVDQLAALTAERDVKQRSLEIAVGQIVLIESQRDALLAFVNGKISRAEMERMLSKLEGVILK